MKWTIILACAITLACSQWSSAQEATPQAEQTTDSASRDWYYGPTSTETATKPLGRLRAEQRAQERAKRIETMRWYGFSASRPTVSGIPFTTIYAQARTRPVYRTFVGYTSLRPVVNVSPFSPGYYRFR